MKNHAKYNKSTPRIGINDANLIEITITIGNNKTAPSSKGILNKIRITTPRNIINKKYVRNSLPVIFNVTALMTPAIIPVSLIKTISYRLL